MERTSQKEEPSGLSRGVFTLTEVARRISSPNGWSEAASSQTLLRRAAKARRVQVKSLGKGGPLIAFSGQRAIGTISSSFSSLCSHQAHRVCSDPYLLNRYLETGGVPASPRTLMGSSQLSQIGPESTYEDLGPRVNLLQLASSGPSKARYGLNSLQKVLEAGESLLTRGVGTGSSRLVMETGVSVPYLRTYVVGEQVSAAIVRAPYFVEGDGVSTIRDLYSQLLQRLSVDNFLQNPLRSEVDSYMEKVGIVWDGVPAAGETFPLMDITRAGAGRAITISIATEIDPELKQLAVDAMWAIPGLSAAAIDISFSGDSPRVFDVNPEADIREFRYPTLGESRRVALDLVDSALRHTQK